MQQLIRIQRIRERAERIGVSLGLLCLEAGLSPSTIYRWLSGDTEPRMHGYEKACSALEEALGRREAAVLQHLSAISSTGQEAAE